MIDVDKEGVDRRGNDLFDIFHEDEYTMICVRYAWNISDVRFVAILAVEDFAQNRR